MPNRVSVTNNEEKDGMIKSVYETNYDVIKNIMKLYEIEQFDLDCTYSTGSFWKNLKEPKIKSDIEPVVEGVLEYNSENLPFEDGSMKSTMYDPPFVIVGKTFKENKKGSSVIAKRFSGFGTFEELKSNYYKSLKELYRITEDKGIVVMKCQDQVSGGKNYFSHILIMAMAEQIGFYNKDLFILTSKVRMTSMGGRWKKQQHARKYHSYFIVLEKRKPRVNYSFDYLIT